MWECWDELRPCMSWHDCVGHLLANAGLAVCQPSVELFSTFFSSSELSGGERHPVLTCSQARTNRPWRHQNRSVIGSTRVPCRLCNCIAHALLSNSLWLSVTQGSSSRRFWLPGLIRATHIFELALYHIYADPGICWPFGAAALYPLLSDAMLCLTVRLVRLSAQLSQLILHAAYAPGWPHLRPLQ
jgi:hypothetical protein